MNPQRSLISRIRSILTALFAVFGAVGVAAAADNAHGPYSTKGDLALWALPTFLLFLFAVYKLGWESFTRGMQEREETQNRLIGEAEAARSEAEELLRDHRGRMEAVDEEIRELIAEAHRDAEHTRQDIVQSARSEAETIKRRALREIERVRDQSLDEIFLTLNNRVISATEDRIRGRLTPTDHQQLINQALGEFAGSTL
ncbi:MAG: hypothetical protein DWQ34_17400 [Planctomycetota bacterium]|nr:MAG: hypothetical protein DWQ29_24195 [Planctomycetota bacterium]REJ90462.1 MAG: hypothetical protein DWQ34_17400 [Planctomycetota bacterium]REK26245.1 MAG: hypothetical protein DWQ41_10210 [Planctomycetota bacterium]REK34377.1 MAG: hypothetical protein DWQ45_13425 [Planctomycetota bacterium]